MPKNIKIEKINVRQIQENWGNQVEIEANSSYSIFEYELKVGQRIEFELSEKDSTFVVVSGALELVFDGQQKKLFKGDKYSFFKQNSFSNLTVINCGTIPLLFIKVECA